MAGARGYRSYRGRGSKGKIILAVILVLVIVASLAFIRMQEYVVYDESGRPRLSLPGESAEQTPPEEGVKTERRIYLFAGICGANNKWVCCQPRYGLGIACQSITSVSRAMQCPCAG